MHQQIDIHYSLSYMKLTSNVILALTPEHSWAESVQFGPVQFNKYYKPFQAPTMITDRTLIYDNSLYLHLIIRPEDSIYDST